MARTLCGKEVILQHALHARAAWGYALGAPTAGPWSCWEQPRPAEVTGPVPKPEACSILSFLRCCGWVLQCSKCAGFWAACWIFVWGGCRSSTSLYTGHPWEDAFMSVRLNVSMQPAHKMSCMMLFSQEQSYIYLYLFRELFCFSTHGIGPYKRSSEFAIYFFPSYLLKLNG